MKYSSSDEPCSSEDRFWFEDWAREVMLLSLARFGFILNSLLLLFGVWSVRVLEELFDWVSGMLGLLLCFFGWFVRFMGDGISLIWDGFWFFWVYGFFLLVMISLLVNWTCRSCIVSGDSVGALVLVSNRLFAFFLVIFQFRNFL